MAHLDAGTSKIAWPSNALTSVPYRVYTDTDEYAREIERIFKGPTWNYLCLAVEIAEPGDYVVSSIGETPVVVARSLDGGIHAFVNRCAHRGALLCLNRRGHGKDITCVYHGWSYDLTGNLTGVAFQRGVQRQGGMPPEFKREDHNLRKLKVVEFCGLIFGSFADNPPDFQSYLGPEISSRIARVMHKPLKVLGRTTQVLPNNWKLYFENVKDTYHASILHTFFTTFEINRLNQRGGVVVDEGGGNHASYTIMDRSLDSTDYKQQEIRSSKDDYRLADPSMLEGVDEFGDGVTLQILTVFPGLVVQQIQNSLAVRQLLPRGVDRCELVWTILGFADDDDAMTEHRLKQANLVGPAGYISMEDGCVGGFVQRAVRGIEEDNGVLMMGGGDASSQTYRATESSVRGFWKKYRALMGV
ncbi:MAG: Rieske 2Fe-2S domain-containing protein [Rhizobiales bacterium]|nr:Rieske 2Fe-2S domain-containing protein [Hyphomicrobiales bacterium]